MYDGFDDLKKKNPSFDYTQVPALLFMAIVKDHTVKVCC